VTSSGEGVVIVGGGLAAARTAMALRDLQYPGRITLLSDETHLPYDRPPLSKAYLLGKLDPDRMRLLTPAKLDELAIELLAGVAASTLDREHRRVLLADGRSLGYEQLVVATGARPNRLAAFEGFDNVHVLRSLDDADRLRAAIGPGRRLCIIGAGFIGLEIASTAIELGGQVELIEAAATPLAAILGRRLGGRIQRWHESKGAVFHCGAQVERVLGAASVQALHLSSGAAVTADAFVVGVGQSASVAWLAGSGLELDRGLVCDEHGRTADPRVFGVGDATCIRSNGRLRPTRHWTATTEQARRAAAALCGQVDAEPVVEDNYFWSDQYGLRLQFAGQVPDDPQLVWVAGSEQDERFAVLCCTGGAASQATAVFSLGCVRDFLTHSMPLRRGEPIPVPAS
jgi:NADPH-dependent 2,4-dienoyl-CoA reductase/sulfur reductase-like enzyme